MAREYRWELAAAAALALLACGAPFAAEALVRRRRRLALHAAGGAEKLPLAVRAAIERWFAASQPDAAGCVCAAAARAAVQASLPRCFGPRAEEDPKLLELLALLEVDADTGRLSPVGCGAVFRWLQEAGVEEAGLLELCKGAELAAWRVALLRPPRPGGAPEPEPAPEPAPEPETEVPPPLRALFPRLDIQAGEEPQAESSGGDAVGRRSELTRTELAAIQRVAHAKPAVPYAERLDPEDYYKLADHIKGVR